MYIMNNQSENMVLKMKKVRENAPVPKRGTKESAGLDLCAVIDEAVIINPGESVVLPTGLAVSVPVGTAGMIFTRSGLGIKHGIHVTNGVGVIDSDYRGEVHVGLHNLSQKAYKIEPMERIAQMIIMPYYAPEIILCDSLDETERGEGGFGSTGRG